MKLYEFSVMVTYGVVVAADSAEVAEAYVRSMSPDYYRVEGHADALGVSDIDLLGERELKSIDDEAHLVVKPTEPQNG